MPFPGVTPLIFAIYGTASAAITRLLLDHHADPNKAAYDGATPLLVATVEGSLCIAAPCILDLFSCPLRFSYHAKHFLMQKEFYYACLLLPPCFTLWLSTD